MVLSKLTFTKTSKAQMPFLLSCRCLCHAMGKAYIQQLPCPWDIKTTETIIYYL